MDGQLGDGIAERRFVVDQQRAVGDGDGAGECAVHAQKRQRAGALHHERPRAGHGAGPFVTPAGVNSVSVPAATETPPVYAAGDATDAEAVKEARSFVSGGRRQASSWRRRPTGRWQPPRSKDTHPQVEA